MRRSIKIFAVVFMALLIRYILLNDTKNITGNTRFLIEASVWYSLICFGCYALATIGWGLLTFGDCPGASKELEKHVEDAKKELKTRGCKFD